MSNISGLSKSTTELVRNSRSFNGSLNEGKNDAPTADSYKQLEEELQDLLYTVREKRSRVPGLDLNVKEQESKEVLVENYSFMSGTDAEDDEDLDQNLMNSFQNVRNQSLTQSFMNKWQEMNEVEIIAKLENGSRVAKQFAIGGIAGLTTSYLVRKFGKLGITALCGGIIILQAAHMKGLVQVNWDNIYTQLQKMESRSEKSWAEEKMKFFRLWARENSVSLYGFIGGFFYRIIT